MSGLNFLLFMEVFESVKIRPDPDPGGPKAKTSGSVT
jgi:hypothetical protein